MRFLRPGGSSLAFQAMIGWDMAAAGECGLFRAIFQSVRMFLI
jgi:hypothetical protein